MKASTTRAQRRRQRIEALIRADPERSNRSIAVEIGGCSHNTVARVRAGLTGPLPTADGPGGAVSGPNGHHPGSENLIAPAGPGNGRAVTHGAYSAARRAPLEAQHRDRLRVEFPQAPDDLLNAAARRCAMLDLFSSWVADNGPIRGRGDVAPAAREMRLLLTDHERAYAALVELDRVGARDGYPTLAEIEAELDEGEPDDAEDGDEEEPS